VENTKDYLTGELILINKEKEWTSFDIVKRIRKDLTNKLKVKKLKVGHAGTLDPLASGLVIICTGKKTKQIDSYQAQIKEYVATIYFGATTPSYDLETEIDFRFDTENITIENVESVLKTFIGRQQQTPPCFSAKKTDGIRAYTQARNGILVEMKSVDIEISEIEIIKFEKPELIIKIICSKGTYIRTLAHDIGKRLNSGAYLKELIRTGIGDFKLSDAQTIAEFENNLHQ